jgi:acyloxyacyl hydrolase
VIAGGLSALRDAVLATSAKLPPAMLFQPASEVAAAEAQAAAEAVLKSGKVPDPCGTNISCLVYRIGTLHLPLLDGDGDAFAPVGNGDLDGLAARAARGSHWRGADCNDANAKIYPGRRAAMGDLIEDTNCNGIVGVDKASGVSYEKLWCTGAHEPRGVVVLGDSASAHFHIPPVWLSAANFSLDQIATDAPIRAADELDVPYCSWSTGHAENASAAAAQCPPVWRMPGAGEPPPSLELKSFYGRLRQRNRCNHRDFQNMGVNGARVGSIAPPHGIVNGMARNPTEVCIPSVLFVLSVG